MLFACLLAHTDPIHHLVIDKAPNQLTISSHCASLVLPVYLIEVLFYNHKLLLWYTRQRRTLVIQGVFTH
jgi:hypothetical protein